MSEGPVGPCKADKGTLRRRVKGGKGALGETGVGGNQRDGEQRGGISHTEVKHQSRVQDPACPMFRQSNGRGHSSVAPETRSAGDQHPQASVTPCGGQ